MKSIKEWIDTLPKDIRDKAYKYEAGSKIDWNEDTPALERAIQLAFSWNSTDEGFYYWWDICERAMAGVYDSTSDKWTHERLVELVKFVYNESRNWVNAEETMTTEQAEAMLKEFQK